MMNECLVLAWAGIISFCIVMYVILDGFTLGTGMLLITLNPHQKDLAMSMILPTWDGNQTWLVLGGASLYGAFPLAFSELLPHFYLPLMFMVIALLFRGVAFEFRLKSQQHKHRWDMIFCIASTVSTFIQGTIVANLVKGLNSSHDYLSPFAIITGVGLITAYLLLGSTRLILKTRGDLQEKMFVYARKLMIISSAILIIVCVWTPFIPPKSHSLWLSARHWLDFGFLPLITLSIGLNIWFALSKKAEYWPYWLSVIFILCPLFGFALNLYPYAVPYTLTLWQTASQPSTLAFILVGALIMLPVLLFYTAYAYHIFRGKVTDVLHY